MGQSFCLGKEVDRWHLCSVGQGIRRCILESHWMMYVPLDDDLGNRRLGSFVC